MEIIDLDESMILHAFLVVSDDFKTEFHRLIGPF
jgi:hypothetical protein